MTDNILDINKLLQNINNTLIDNTDNTIRNFLNNIEGYIIARAINKHLSFFGGRKVILTIKNQTVKIKLPNTLYEVLSILRDPKKDIIYKFIDIYKKLISSSQQVSYGRHPDTQEMYKHLINNFNEHIEQIKKLKIYSSSSLEILEIISLISKARRFQTNQYAEQDMTRDLNFCMPAVLNSLNDIEIEAENNFDSYKMTQTPFKFVIDTSGFIKFGFDSPQFCNNFTNARQKLKEAGVNLHYNDKRDLVMSKIYGGVVAVSSHAALNNYEEVIAAGKITYDYDSKQITLIFKHSGHYKPDEQSLDLAIKLFKLYYPNQTGALRKFRLFN